MTPQTQERSATTTPSGAAAPPVHAVTLDPGDERLFLQRDPMHFPDPLAPMEAVMVRRTLGPGFTHGLRTYNAPVDRVEVRVLEGHYYHAIVPAEGTPEELQARGAAAEAAVIEVLGHLRELWEETILPEVQEHLAMLDAFDLEAASHAALAGHLDDVWERVRRVWELHFDVVVPLYLAISEFDELYRGLFPDAGPLDSYKLLEGLPNMTVEVGQALWQLSRRALADETVRSVLATHPAREVPAVLAATPEGRAFLTELHAYLDRYGRRADTWTILMPSWTEDPTPVVESLREFVLRPETDAPAVTTEAAAAGREAAIAEVRERLAGYPGAVVGQFEAMLGAAQVATVISEDHNFWIDNMFLHHLRAALIAAGRRMVADGAIDDAEDVMMLVPDEVDAALRSPGRDLHATVAERRAVMERRRAMNLPPAVGTIPAGPPPDDAIGRFAAKFFGAPPAAPEAAGEVRGAPGSAGRVRGTARVIRSIAEAGRLQPGDIIVAETTAPSWTPLFATVAAVVTDTGGVLSHCAVVAREYAIPAVVGTAVGSSVIADGQTIEVDGDAGIVRIV